MPRASSSVSPLVAAADGVRIAVRLTPRGGRDHIEGIVRGADDAAALKVSVAAPPEDGRANDALIQLFAKEWRIARRDIAIVLGAKSRNKTVHIAGDPAALLQRLGAALAVSRDA